MRFALSACSQFLSSDQKSTTFTGDCIQCKQHQTVIVQQPELHSYHKGVPIQSALSNPIDEREFLISGICGTCYDNLFEEDK